MVVRVEVELEVELEVEVVLRDEIDKSMDVNKSRSVVVNIIEQKEMLGVVVYYRFNIDQIDGSRIEVWFVQIRRYK